MMCFKKFNRPYRFVFPLLLLFTAFSQVMPVEELLQEYYSAVGKEQYERIPSIYVKGRLVPASGPEVYFKSYVKSPDQLRVEWANGGNRWIEIYNKGMGWRKNGEEVNPLNGQALFNLALLAKYTSPLRGLAPETLTAGEIKVDEEYFDALELQLENEKIEFLFDNETHLLAFQRISVSEDSELIPMEIQYQKYRDLGGIKIAFAYKIRTNTTTSELLFDELVLGYPAPSSFFDPSNK